MGGLSVDVVLDRLDRLTKIILVILIAVMASVAAANVFCRYVLNAALMWAEELARYCMIWAGFLGSASLVHTGSHISVSVVVDLLPVRMRKYSAVLVLVGSIVFFAVVIVEGIQLMALTRGQVGASLRVLPMSIVYSVIPVSGFIMLLNSLWQLALIWRQRAE